LQTVFLCDPRPPPWDNFHSSFSKFKFLAKNMKAAFINKVELVLSLIYGRRI